MASRGDVFWIPASRTRMTVEVSAEDGGGRELVVLFVVAPGERLPSAPHVHFGAAGAIVERFEILKGRAGCRIGGEERVAEAPHMFDIPAETSHVHPWNAGDGELHVRQTVLPSPPDTVVTRGVERFFETLAALAQQGRVSRNGDIRNPLQAALTVKEFLLPFGYLAGPPRAVQNVMFRVLPALARRLGYQAYVAPEISPRQD